MNYGCGVALIHLLLELCRMGPASTINHAFTQHLLPTIPLPGIDRCKEIQFMALVLKEITFQLRKQGVYLPNITKIHDCICLNTELVVRQ